MIILDINTVKRYEKTSTFIWCYQVELKRKAFQRAVPDDYGTQAPVRIIPPKIRLFTMYSANFEKKIILKGM